MKPIRGAALALVIGLVACASQSNGCAEVQKVLPSILPTVLSWVGEYMLAVDAIADHVEKRNPSPEVKAQADALIGTLRSLGAIMQRTARGTDSASRLELDDAKAQFIATYNELLKLCGPLGVKAAKPGEQRMRSAPGELTVPPIEDEDFGPVSRRIDPAEPAQAIAGVRS